MKKRKLRDAFSMITAVFLIVIMSTIGIFVMNLSGKVIKTTTAQFQDAQAQLYAKSYTEFAILAITGHDRGSNCVEEITGNIAGGYSIRTYIAYIGTNAEIGNCSGTRQLGNSLTTKTPLTIMIDVYVNYTDLDDANQTLTAHRRTIQKI